MAEPNFANQTIWTGDNLPIMRGMNSESVDLICFDPPFNSNANYAAPIGSQAAGAEFKDTWSLSDIDAEWINLISNKYPELYRVLLAAMADSAKSYLVYMAARLLEMRRILKSTGSIYLHCDPTMSHYLKLIMDAIFVRSGGKFLNEIVWAYRKWTNAATYFQRNHDVLLYYARGMKHTFNKVLVEPTQSQAAVVARGYNVNRVKSKGKSVYQLLIYDQEKVDTLVANGELDLGKYDAVVNRDGQTKTGANDVWQIQFLHAHAKERTGYPTQKPLALYRRMIEASSNEGDMVLDPFCGCATTCIAAQDLERQWAGIDIASKAIELTKMRLRNELGLFSNPIHRTDIPLRSDLGKLVPYNSMENKAELYGNQGGYCAGCNTHFEPRHLEVDHIIARSKGGTDHIGNLQLLCGSCNRIKGNRGMEYLRAKLQLTV